MNHISLTRILVALSVASFAVLPIVTATSIRPPSFAQLVDQSDRVVRAAVQSIRSYEDSYEGEQIVRTGVTLTVLESINGNVPTGELKIRLLGGEVPGLRLDVGGMPKFEVGKELVLFLHPQGRFICPTVGWGHGKYYIDRSGADGVARVRRSNGNLLQNLQQISAPIHPHGEQVNGLSAGFLSGMSLDQFRLSVQQRVEPGRQSE